MRNYARLFETSMTLLMPGDLLMAPNLSAQNRLSTLELDKTSQLRGFFSYKGDGAILVSGHHGGCEMGYVKSCIEELENVLTQMPAPSEVDPRLTKDNMIVLMHNIILDRTTTGKDKAKDYTWEEFQSFRLKDHSGEVTNYRIPTLEEVIVWSRDKTITNLDKEDAPVPMIAALIKEYRTEKHVMLIAHTGAQARYYYDRFPDIMMSVLARDMRESEDISISDVPWENMITHIGHTLTPENSEICETFRAYGVRCMVSVAPRHDKPPTIEERVAKYKEKINKRSNIIESDIPTEIWKVLYSR